MSRVGHAFFKARMREEHAFFGGEVSGHYYFREFWCADSGTIPALLMLELISVEGRGLAEMMSEFRSYFIRRDQPRSPTSRRRWRRSPSAIRRRDHLPGRGLGTIPTGTSTSALQHRAAAAPQSGVLVARGHGPEETRCWGHLIVKLSTRRSVLGDGEAQLTPDRRWSAEAGIHQLRIPTPFAVGRVNCYLIEDMLTLPPAHSARADELQHQPPITATDRRSGAVILTHQHIDHLAGGDHRRAPGAEVAAIDVAVRRLANSARTRARGRVCGRADAPSRDSRERRHALRASRAAW